MVRSVAVILLLAAGFAAPAAASAPSTPPSAIGNEFVSWIAVSPDYLRTGLVVAVSTVTSCPKGTSCTHLWVTHDGGSSWRRAAAAGFGGRPVIVVDGHGHEVMLSQASGLRRSDDYGDTWKVAGPDGLPAPSPAFGRDATVATAGAADYLHVGGRSQKVPGSGGAYRDQAFALTPTWGASATEAPALLVGETSSNLPVVQRCDARLACSGTASLPGAPPAFESFPVTLWPSSGWATDGTVFAQAGRGIYKSRDGGRTFTPVVIYTDSPEAATTPAMALARGYAEAGPVRRLYVALLEIYQSTTPTSNQSPRSAGGVVLSDDGGVTWAKVGAGSPLDWGASAVAVAPDGRLFAGYFPHVTPYAGLLCSADGRSWHARCSAVGQGSRAGGGSTAGGSPPSTPVRSSPTVTPAAGGAGANPAAGLLAPGGAAPFSMPALLLLGVLALLAAGAAIIWHRARRD